MKKKTIEIPPHILLGAYAEDHGDEICEFVERLLGTKTKPVISESDPYSDEIEVEFNMEWECDGETVTCEDYVSLHGSFHEFLIGGSFCPSRKDRAKWARWCFEHCGHWAYSEES